MRGQEKSVAILLFGGIALAILSVIVGVAVGWTNLGNSSGSQSVILIWIAGVSIGFVMAVSGLGLGLAKSKGWFASKEEQMIQDCRIVAVLALSPKGQPVWNEEAYDASEISRFVHLRLPSGQVKELRFSTPLLAFMGEGMKGNAVIQGDSLIGFQATGT